NKDVDHRVFVQSTNGVKRVDRTALELQLNAVLTVDREHVSERHAAASAERQIVAHSVCLKHRLGQLQRVGQWPHTRLADRGTADLARDKEISIQQARRD